MPLEAGLRLPAALQSGLRLLALVVGLQILSNLYNLLWAIPWALKIGALCAFAYVGLFVWFGYKARAGFWRGMLIGAIGVSPGLALLAFSLFTLATNGMADGGPLWVMLPWAGPFFSLGSMLPPQWPGNWLPHGSVPAAILLTALASWLSGRRAAHG